MAYFSVFSPFIYEVHVTFWPDLLQAIDEAAFSVAYANMCRCLIPVSDICFNKYCRIPSVIVGNFANKGQRFQNLLIQFKDGGK